MGAVLPALQGHCQEVVDERFPPPGVVRRHLTGDVLDGEV
jgi:hypothetical protein